MESTDLALLEHRINDAARASALVLVRVAEVCGQFAAVFEISPNASYAKTFGTRWYDNPSELLSTVLDTLEHLSFDKETVDVNIFSAAMFEYLSAEMLPAGKVISLTIKDAEESIVAGPRGEELKVKLHFVERPKKLILNKTNARALAKYLGPETTTWRGASVALGVENVKVGRNTVPSVRVKSATPANGRAAPTTYAITSDGMGNGHAGQGDEEDGQQDDLFGAEYDARQEELKAAALATARNG